MSDFHQRQQQAEETVAFLKQQLSILNELAGKNKHQYNSGRGVGGRRRRAFLYFS